MRFPKSKSKSSVSLNNYFVENGQTNQPTEAWRRRLSSTQKFSGKSPLLHSLLLWLKAAPTLTLSFGVNSGVFFDQYIIFPWPKQSNWPGLGLWEPMSCNMIFVAALDKVILALSRGTRVKGGAMLPSYETKEESI